MAKKGARILFGLICEVCKKQNYVSEKNKITTTNAIKLIKYCNKCKKRTTHKENKKLD